MKNFKILCVIFFGLISCNQTSKNFIGESHRQGKAKLLVEESFKPLFDTSIYTFEGLYPNADIQVDYDVEDNIIKKVYNKEIESFVISRDLTKEERNYLKTRKIEVRSERIALDAIALIINPKNLDSNLTVNFLKDVLTGKISKWKNGKQIEVVFDNNNSANYNFLKDYCDMTRAPKNVYTLKSNEQVIKHIKKSENAIGVIGLNWISDQEDFDVLDFLDGIKVVSVAKDEKSSYFLPYSGMIYTKEYPLIREIWIHNYASKSGLNSGFVNFMVGENGQLLIHKSGLVPANAPVRLIQFTDKF